MREYCRPTSRQSDPALIPSKVDCPVTGSIGFRVSAHLPAHSRTPIENSLPKSFIMTNLPVSPTGRGICEPILRNSLRMTILRSRGGGGSTYLSSQNGTPSSVGAFGDLGKSVAGNDDDGRVDQLVLRDRAAWLASSLASWFCSRLICAIENSSDRASLRQVQFREYRRGLRQVYWPVICFTTICESE